MTSSDVKLEKLVTRAMGRHARVPDFDTTWCAAEARYRQGRRRYRALSGIAVTVAVAAIVINTFAPQATQMPLIEMGELLGSTSWQAPSDALLPDRRFDIYQELPALIESTETATGAFL